MKSLWQVQTQRWDGFHHLVEAVISGLITSGPRGKVSALGHALPCPLQSNRLPLLHSAHRPRGCASQRLLPWALAGCQALERGLEENWGN